MITALIESLFSLVNFSVARSITSFMFDWFSEIDVLIFSKLELKSARFTAFNMRFKSLFVSNKSLHTTFVSFPISLTIPSSSDLNCLKSNWVLDSLTIFSKLSSLAIMFLLLSSELSITILLKSLIADIEEDTISDKLLRESLSAIFAIADFMSSCFVTKSKMISFVSLKSPTVMSLSSPSFNSEFFLSSI